MWRFMDRRTKSTSIICQTKKKEKKEIVLLKLKT
jgi:hypothetical protein